MRRSSTLLGAVPFYAPALLLTMFFVMVPVASSFFYALTDWNGFDPVLNFVGLANFQRLFTDDMVVNGFLNTMVFALAVTVLQNVCGLGLAIALDIPFKGRAVLRAAFFLPAILSALVVGYSWSYILNPLFGVLNNALIALKLDFLVSDWLGSGTLALPSLIFIVIWQFMGYSMVIYLAGMQGVPKELYEASDIDGAGPVRKFITITFPLIAPAFTINVLLSMIGTMKMFDLIFVTTGGGPGYATETLATVLYNQAFQTSRMGFGTAIAIVQFAVILVLSAVQLRVLRRREEVF